MLLPGYIEHPDNREYQYNPTTGDVQPLAQAAAAPSGGAFSAPGQLAPAGAMPEFPEMTKEDLSRDFSPYDGKGRGDTIWINFPELAQKTVGAESELLVRLVPLPAAMQPEPNSNFLVTAYHRIFADLVPIDTGTRQFWQTTCYDVAGGPGDCPMCALVKDASTSGNDEMVDFVSNLKPKRRQFVQAIDLNDPGKHWVQVIDEHTQSPMLDAAGQPTWKIVPGVLEISKTMFDDIIALGREYGDQTGLTTGQKLRLKKARTGMAKFDVDHKVFNIEPMHLIGSQFENALHNTLDLRDKCLKFRERDLLDKVRNAVRIKYGLGPVSVSVPGTAAAPAGDGWQPHPQNAAYEWNPATGQLRPAQPVAPPVPQAPALPPTPPAVPTAAVPAPAPAVPAAPPVAAAASPQLPLGVPATPPAPPAAPQAAPAAVPAPPAGLPPAAAPGLAGAAPGVPAAPPAPPPGMPAGAPVGPPATPPAPPAAALTPEQLEQQVKEKLPY